MSILIIDVNGYKSSNDNVFYAREMAWAIIKKDEMEAIRLPTYWGKTYYCDNPNLPMPNLNLADPMVAYLHECLHGLPLHPQKNSFRSDCRWSSQLIDEMRSIYEIAMVIAKSDNTALSLASTAATYASAAASSSAATYASAATSASAIAISSAVSSKSPIVNANIASTDMTVTSAAAATATSSAAAAATSTATATSTGVTVVHCGRTPGLITLELLEIAITGLPVPEKITIPPLGKGVPPCHHHGSSLMKNSARCSLNEVVKRIGSANISRMVQIDALAPSIMAPGINIFSSK